jgi:hypothetical protein
MPWEYILGGAGGAGIVVVLGVLLAQKLIERTVDSQFEARLEHLRGELNTKLERLRGELTRKLEFDKSDLTVWAELRKDVLMEMWDAHREINKEMTTVILKTQELERKHALAELEPSIDEYRRSIHSRIDLLSPKGLDICQRFLGTAYSIQNGDISPNDANPLKSIRTDSLRYTAKLYGLEKMMPWMARNPNEPPS